MVPLGGDSSQNLGDDRACEDRIDGEHEPAPGHSDIERDRQERVFVKVVVSVRGEMLCVSRPTKDCSPKG